MKIEARPWTPQDLLDELQSIIDEEPDHYLNTRRSTLCMARDYLKECFLSPPNDPLTIEQLREMDGEPVWVTHKDGSGGRWGIVNIYPLGICADVRSGQAYWFEDYIGTIAYRRKPEEVTIQ